MVDRDPRGPDDEEDPDLPEDFGEEEGTSPGSVDDEGGDDAETGPEPEGDQAGQAAQTQRVRRRDDQVREELRALREHNARVEAELNAIRQERQQRQFPQEETNEQFLARISLLEPYQQMEAKLDRATRFNQRQVALATFAAADRADKAAFDSKAAHDPIYRKYAAEVEQVLQIERNKGRDFDRETVLDFVRGRRARLNQGRQTPAQRQGRENIQRQQARTSGGRSDQGRDQRPRRYAASDMSPEAVRARLNAPDAFI